MNTITLSSIEDGHACELHTGAPLHLTTDCHKIKGANPYSMRLHCSVCELPWDGRVAVSQHLNCGAIMRSGRIERAHPVLTTDFDGEPAEIRYADPQTTPADYASS